MRLDHIAYRVKSRVKTAEFFIKAFGYKVQTEFDLDFGNDGKVKCIALTPPEKLDLSSKHLPWLCESVIYEDKGDYTQEHLQQYHIPPEIFVSDGGSGTIVGEWVAARGGVGGIHHLAYQVDSVEDKVEEWKQKGYAEFSSEEPFRCPGLTQIFTKPSELTGVVYEFIKREDYGFCAGNVKQLMLSTVDAGAK